MRTSSRTLAAPQIPRPLAALPHKRLRRPARSLRRRRGTGNGRRPVGTSITRASNRCTAQHPRLHPRGPVRTWADGRLARRQAARKPAILAAQVDVPLLDHFIHLFWLAYRREVRRGTIPAYIPGHGVGGDSCRTPGAANGTASSASGSPAPTATAAPEGGRTQAPSTSTQRRPAPGASTWSPAARPWCCPSPVAQTLGLSAAEEDASSTSTGRCTAGSTAEGSFS